MSECWKGWSGEKKEAERTSSEDLVRNLKFSKSRPIYRLTVEL